MIRIGKIAASHGLSGTLVFTHVTGKSDWLEAGAFLFLEIMRGSFIPFYVESAKAVSDDEYLVQLEDVTTMEAAKKLTGSAVYGAAELLEGIKEETPVLWIGYNIVDKNVGSIGAIEDVFQTGAQWLAKVDYQGKEVLIPLIDQMILDVNKRNKFIRMELPDGLLEL